LCIHCIPHCKRLITLHSIVLTTIATIILPEMASPSYLYPPLPDLAEHNKPAAAALADAPSPPESGRAIEPSPEQAPASSIAHLVPVPVERASLQQPRQLYSPIQQELDESAIVQHYSPVRESFPVASHTEQQPVESQSRQDLADNIAMGDKEIKEGDQGEFDPCTVIARCLRSCATTQSKALLLSLFLTQLGASLDLTSPRPTTITNNIILHIPLIAHTILRSPS
jgi:hypothetical protein